ncbi:YybH family protein [Puia sp. P3]|uniref:YybH family protein n=1 Tax=Puia sp. P3 TaxID=3423952 RepID=UPI003D66B6C2
MKKLKSSRLSFLLISALTIFTAGRSVGATPGHYTGTDSVIDEITKIERQYKEAFITGDSALFLKCYTPDACILAPNVPSLCGERGRLQFYKGARQAGIRDAVFTSLGLYGQTPEYVTQQGAVELFDAAQHAVAKAKVLIVWKMTPDGWRIFRHMVNFDTPMPPSAKN